MNIAKEIYFKIFGKYRLVSCSIENELEKDWTILDVGCGHSSPLRLVKKTSRWVGLDIYEPYIAESKKQSIHDEYLIGDARSLPFKDNSFDCAVAIEVLEHFNKPDGLKMINEMERVARKKIILTTPNGFMETYAGPNDNPEERHLSGWNYNELKELKFRVYGLNGLKSLWTIEKGKAVIRFKFLILPIMLVEISKYFTYRNPSLSFQLFFVKDLNKLP